MTSKIKTNKLLPRVYKERNKNETYREKEETDNAEHLFHK